MKYILKIALVLLAAWLIVPKFFTATAVAAAIYSAYRLTPAWRRRRILKIEDRLRRLESDAESFDAIAADNRSRKRELTSGLEPGDSLTEDGERLLNEYETEAAAASQDARDAEREMDRLRAELTRLRQRS